jgi:hypothetical protein
MTSFKTEIDCPRDLEFPDGNISFLTNFNYIQFMDTKVENDKIIFEMMIHKERVRVKTPEMRFSKFVQNVPLSGQKINRIEFISNVDLKMWLEPNRNHKGYVCLIFPKNENDFKKYITGRIPLPPMIDNPHQEENHIPLESGKRLREPSAEKSSKKKPKKDNSSGSGSSSGYREKSRERTHDRRSRSRSRERTRDRRSRSRSRERKTVNESSALREIQDMDPIMIQRVLEMVRRENEEKEREREKQAKNEKILYALREFFQKNHSSSSSSSSSSLSSPRVLDPRILGHPLKGDIQQMPLPAPVPVSTPYQSYMSVYGQNMPQQVYGYPNLQNYHLGNPLYMNPSVSGVIHGQTQISGYPMIPAPAQAPVPSYYMDRSVMPLPAPAPKQGKYVDRVVPPPPKKN